MWKDQDPDYDLIGGREPDSPKENEFIPADCPWLDELFDPEDE